MSVVFHCLTSDLVSCSGDEGGDDPHEYPDGQASQGHREKGEEGQQDLEGGDVWGLHLVESVHGFVNNDWHAI